MSAAVLSRADTSVKLLDVQAIAEMLGCSSRHVYRLSDFDRMPVLVRLVNPGIGKLWLSDAQTERSLDRC